MAFDPSTKADKAQLYQALKAIAKLSYDDTVDLVIDRAIGHAIPHGDNWQRNYRRGEYDATIAQIVHRWVEKHYFTVAHEVAADIFPNTPARQWRKILDKRTDDSRLNLVLVQSSLGVVQRESQFEAVKQVIKLGQRFCLELDSDIDGYAVALQGRGDQWNVIPLGLDGKQAVGAIKFGINRLPQLPNGQLDPIWEDSDEGITDFVVISAKADKIPLEIERQIKWVFDYDCAIYRSTIRFEC